MAMKVSHLSERAKNLLACSRMARAYWAVFLLGSGFLLKGNVARGQSGEAAPPVRAPQTVSRTQEAGVRRYDLSECLKLARKNYPKIGEANARLRQKRSQLTQAKTAPYSQFSSTAGLGLAPTTRGTNVYSPDSDASLSSDMGVAWQVGVEGAIPLWTFGKITNLIAAADAQVRLGQHELKKEQNAVLLQVRTAYYGVQLARDSLALVLEASARIDKYLPRLEQKVDAGDGDDIELLKMKMYRADLTARQIEAKREELKALSGLRFLTGVAGTFDISDTPLVPVRQRVGELSRYLELARVSRPEVNMARAGVAARNAQWELERSKYYPDLALGLSTKWSKAPQVTDQRNPFVGEDGNSLRYGAALVFKWNLDFWPQSARVEEAQAKLEEVQATERFALGGVGVEVEQAFRDAQAAEARLAAVGAAVRYSKQWLVKVQQGIDVGTMDDQDIVDPAKEYAVRRFGRLTAIFDFNSAMAKLALASGSDTILDPR